MFRWFALVALAGAITVSAYHRRRARILGGTIPRRQEGGLLVAGRLLVGLPLFGSVLLYLIHPAWMAWAAFAAPPWLRGLGVALGLACIPAVHAVLRTLGQNVSETVLTKAEHQLVTGGPYRWIRHPLYTTGITLFIALGLMAANAFIIAWALAALLAVRLIVVPLEERALIDRFGDTYRQYIRRTGAMLPRFLRSR